jgi:DNA-binding LytR/AlgR family response regulator
MIFPSPQYWGYERIFFLANFAVSFYQNLNNQMNTYNITHTCEILRGRLHFKRTRKTIDLSEIIMLQANVNYTIFFLKSGKQFLSARSIKLFELMLGGHGFIRTHRAYLINREHLLKCDEPKDSVTLSNNLTALISRRRKGNLTQF